MVVCIWLGCCFRFDCGWVAGGCFVLWLMVASVWFGFVCFALRFWCCIIWEGVLAAASAGVSVFLVCLRWGVWLDVVFGCFDLRFDAGLSGGLGWLLVFSGCLRSEWVVLRWLFCLFLGFLGAFFSCGVGII